MAGSDDATNRFQPVRCCMSAPFLRTIYTSSFSWMKLQFRNMFLSINYGSFPEKNMNKRDLRQIKIFTKR